MSEFPRLSSPHRLLQKGIDLLHRHAPKIAHYLAHQRALSLLDDVPVEVDCPEEMDEEEVRRRLARWMAGKRNRRILYIILELAILPFAAVAGLLPGPNVLFYSVFVLFVLHLLALLKLSQVKIRELPLTLRRRPPG